MPLATIRPMGESGLYHIHFLDRGSDPGFDRPEGGHPGQGLPPMHGHPDQGLPGQPGHIANRPPGTEHPGGRPPQHGAGIPDNELPSTPPPTVAPGCTLVMVRGPQGRWEYAAIDPGQPPPKPIQGPPGHAGQPLPGQPPHASGQPVPPQGQPPIAGQPLPPTAGPRR